MFSRRFVLLKYRKFSKSLQCMQKPQELIKGCKLERSTFQNIIKSSEETIKKHASFLGSFQGIVDKQLEKIDSTKAKVNNQVKQKLNSVLDNLGSNKRAAIFGASAVYTFQDPPSKEVPETNLSEVIPEPPPVPDVGTGEFLEQVNALGEATFASMGLGGWSPVGLAQNCFEYLHVTLGIPWWEAILIGTFVIRICMFPLVVIAQRNAAKMNNNMPQMQVIQLKLTEARQTGNQLEAARYSQEMMTFMKEKQMNPFKNMLVPIAQMPVFISFFVALRQMANLPVDSLRTGGLWWFTDLTVPDQFFIMPIITSVTLWATIELGTDTAKLTSQNLQTMKYVLRALPVVILPFTVSFPGAILVYWTSTNFISLAQVGFLKIPRIRQYFDIDQLVEHTTETLPMKPKGFTEGIKDSWTNMKIVNELEQRKRLDEIQFNRAGKGPIVKTFKYDPTKKEDPISPAPVSAKKR